MVAAPTPSPRAEALRRTYVAAFLALDDLKKTDPAGAAEIEIALVSHIRAAMPMRLYDTGPVVKMTPVPVRPEVITERIGERAFYELRPLDDDRTLLYLHDELEHDADVALTPTQVEALREHLAQSGGGR